MERGIIIDCGMTNADAAYRQHWYEVANYMVGPLASFTADNNVINAEIWSSIPSDLQQILLEEAAKSELEALRLASVQNDTGIPKNVSAGLEFVPFSAETRRHSFQVAVMQHVIPNWVERVGGPHSSTVRLFNDKVGPIVGLRIRSDGSAEATR